MNTVISFILTLEEDLVLSQSGATAGNHQTLDFIPGSALRGLAAGRLYPELDSQQAWQLFHSGMLRFGDAWPVVCGEVAWPIPLAWHHLKGEQPAVDGQLCPDRLLDPAREAVEKGQQPVQLRGGYVTHGGVRFFPATGSRSKTAINPDTGRAAESQLFSYQHLCAGQQFAFALVADDGIDEAWTNKVVDALTGPGRLGRSRSAQYGGVNITRSDTVLWPERKQADDGVVRLWLLSDLLQLDAGGACTLTPEPALLGLPEGSRWLQEKSHLRSRRYSRFNGFRRHWEPELAVISRGSVLAFQLPEGTEVEDVPVLCLGAEQVCGLGMAVANPALLSQPRPQFSTPASDQKGEVVSPAQRPRTPLVAVLNRRAGTNSGMERIDRLARDLLDQLIAALGEARRWAGLRDFEPVKGPGRSQWGRLRELASQHRSEDRKFYEMLFDGEHAVIRARDGQPGWALELGPNETISGRFKTLLTKTSEQNPDVPLAELVGRLAALALGEHWERHLQGYNPLNCSEQGV